MNTENQQKCLLVTIAGATNAGKSTLINQLVGKKVAIVTPKAQTTRTKFRAITMFRNTQMIFTDTPGVFEAKTSFDRSLVNAAWGALRDCDVMLLLVDAKNYNNVHVREIIERLKTRRASAMLVINKADLVCDEILNKIHTELSSLYQFTETFVISALKNLGVDNLMDYLERAAPVGPWLYPEDQLIDAPTRFLAAEITREKLFLNLDQELPYSTAVLTEQMEEKPDGSVVIRQVIYVLKKNHKTIIIGTGGACIKNISVQSRIDLEKILEKKIHLFLFVKVCEFWQNRPQEYVQC